MPKRFADGRSRRNTARRTDEVIHRILHSVNDLVEDGVEGDGVAEGGQLPPQRAGPRHTAPPCPAPLAAARPAARRRLACNTADGGGGRLHPRSVPAELPTAFRGGGSNEGGGSGGGGGRSGGGSGSSGGGEAEVGDGLVGEVVAEDDVQGVLALRWRRVG